MPCVKPPAETRACFFPSPGEKDVAMEIRDCITSLSHLLDAFFLFFSPTPWSVYDAFFFQSEITNTRRDASEETQTGRAVTGRSAQPSPLTLRCPCGTCAGLRGEGGETAPNLGHPAPKKSPASMQQWQRDHSAPCQCCRAGSLLRRWGGGCTNRGGFCTPNSSGFCNSNFSVFLSPNSNGSPPGWDAPSPSHCPSTCPTPAGACSAAHLRGEAPVAQSPQLLQFGMGCKSTQCKREDTTTTAVLDTTRVLN